MKLSNIFRSLCLIILLQPFTSFGQGAYFYRSPFMFLKQYNRFEVGITYPMTTAEFNGTASIYDFTSGTGSFLRDTVVKRTINGFPGIGGSFGVTLPVARLGRTAAIGLSIHALYNSFIWTDLTNSYNSAGVATSLSGESSFLATTQQFAFPISLDLKIGSDALAIHARRLGISVGGGIMPQQNSTIMMANGTSAVSVTQSYFSTIPFAMAEFSLYAYDCFRIRAYYTLGDYKLFDYSETAGGVKSFINMTGKSNLILSVTVLPLSYQWKKIKKEWWNDYDTELPYR